MHFDIVTIFPDAFTSYFDTSILKRAQKKKLVDIRVHDLRDYTTDKHRTVDDKPYGGGAGMVMKVEPIHRAVTAIKKSEIRNSKSETNPKSKNRKNKTILLAANGKQFNQRMAERFATLDRLVLIAGHYEGVDERVMKFVDEAVSVGPYVLTGGELPAMTIVDAVTRLLPGVLGNPESLKEESFGLRKSQMANGTSKKTIRNSQFATCEYPHYTRPEVFSPRRGVRWTVPKGLLSGNHAKIIEWRKKQSK